MTTKRSKVEPIRNPALFGVVRDTALNQVLAIRAHVLIPVRSIMLIAVVMRLINTSFLSALGGES